MAAEADIEMYLRHLRAQREHVLSAFERLGEERLRRGILPSGWSPKALVHHLTIDVEMWWFGAVVAGDADVLAEVEVTDGWIPPDVPAAEIIERYVEAGRRSDEIARRAGVDGGLAWWPDDTPRHRRNVADVLLHVIAETAAHAGHADAAAELVDGRQWLVLT